MKYFRKITNAIKKSADSSKYQFFSFGVFGFITYPLYHFIWLFTGATTYENFPLRILASLLCIPLIIKKHLPSKLQKILPFYWYLLLIYCLPFFFTFMALKNNLSILWLLNVMSALVWGVLLFDAVSLLVIIAIGGPLGWVAYKLTTPNVYLPEHYLTLIFLFSSVLVFSIIFSTKKEKAQEEKLQAMQSLGAIMAHELRTPLRTINLANSSVKKYLPALIEMHEGIIKANLHAPIIKSNDYEALTTACGDIESEIKSTFTIIEMLIAKVNQLNISSTKSALCSINNCVSQALKRYPFNLNESSLLQWEEENDFKFIGNEQLIVHVLFNLLKNAIFSIKKSGKGNIKIWTKIDTKYNFLYFRDTGEGISPEDLFQIFDRFYTKTQHGAGLGLSFCKLVMRSIGGNITCHSTKGEYAEFILYFPKVNS
jgi:signal transduction histidine kinase